MFYTACNYCKRPGSAAAAALTESDAGPSRARGTHKHEAEDSAGRPGPRVPKAHRPELSQTWPNRPARCGIAAPARHLGRARRVVWRTMAATIAPQFARTSRSHDAAPSMRSFGPRFPSDSVRLPTSRCSVAAATRPLGSGCTPTGPTPASPLPAARAAGSPRHRRRRAARAVSSALAGHRAASKLVKSATAAPRRRWPALAAERPLRRRWRASAAGRRLQLRAPSACRCAIP